MKLYFLSTCYACPEQYDVYRENGEICSYVRLRWGNLIVEYPDVSGEIIYHECFEDNFKGMFDDDIERQKYLSEISNVISNKVCGKEVNTEYEIFTDIDDLRKRLNNE